MRSKQPESNVRALVPEPKINYRRRNEADTGVEMSVTVWTRHRAPHVKISIESVEFIFSHLDKTKGAYKNKLDLTRHSRSPLTEKEFNAARLLAKDTLFDVYGRYKR
jgi:hypothetical protein